MTRTLTSPPDLTGELAVRVARVALDTHPGSVVSTVEMDDAGRFLARLTSPLGEKVLVRLDADLAVLGWVVELA
jgi:hypothetical protein